MKRIIPIFIILVISLVISLSLILYDKEIRKEKEILKEKEEIERFRFFVPEIPEEELPISPEGMEITEERVGEFRFFVPSPSEPRVIEEKREEIKIEEYQLEGRSFFFPLEK